MKKEKGQDAEEPSDFDYSILPVDIGIYEQVIFIIKKALGVLYDTDYYVAKRAKPGQPNSGEGIYLKPHVFFDRFCFDLVSLLGEYLNLLTFSDVEYIMRKIYQHSTHFFFPLKG